MNSANNQGSENSVKCFVLNNVYDDVSFLVDEPKLRNLLHGISDEDNGIGIANTMNRLILFFAMIKWINFEVWWCIGDVSGIS